MRVGDFHLFFLDSVVKRSRLPVIENARSEHLKLNVARIITGLVMMSRTGLIAAAAVHYFDSGDGGSELALALAMMVLLLLFTVGLFTPLATLGLLLTYNSVDMKLLTANLASSMSTLLLWVFLVASAGTAYSADAYLMRKNVPVVAPLLRRLYGLLKVPDGSQLRIYYFIFFLAYALTNLGAVWHHLSDAYWTGGHTMEVVLTNSYLSKWYDAFRSLEATWPAALNALSIFLLIFQSIWQLFMLPLIYFRWGARFVIAWGWVFFAGSLVLLQLSMLPLMQMLVWFVLFVPGKRDGTPGSQLPLGQRPLVVSVLLVLGLCANLLFALQLPFVPHTLARHGYAQWLLYRAGLNFPVVFNESDLRLGDTWPVITRQYAGGASERVPFTHADGSRDWYHYSDLLYFGNSVRWRRHGIGLDPVSFNSPGADGYERIAQVIAFDRRLHDKPDPVVYRVDIFQNAQSNIKVPAPQRYVARLVHTYTLQGWKP